jgi:Fur family peroxide stress response transcriptional regulator
MTLKTMPTEEELRCRFRECGLRLTPQRAAIYRALVRTTSHPTAEALYASVRRTYPNISQNTVYYTLSALRRAGLAQEVNYGHDGARFDGNLALHHHLICVACHRIEDVMDERLDRLPLAIAVTKGFEISRHRVEFYGFCEPCRRKSRSAKGRS